MVLLNGFSAQSMTPILHQAWLEERIRALPDTDAVFYADVYAPRQVPSIGTALRDR